MFNVHLFKKRHVDDFVKKEIFRMKMIGHVENMYDNNNQSKHHKNYVEEQVHNWQMLVDLHMLVQHEFLNTKK